MRRAAGASMVCALTGCSFVFVDTVPDSAPPVQIYACDESYVWPVVDGVLAAVYAAAGIAALSDDGSGSEAETGFLGSSLVGAALFGVSGFWGRSKVRTCREKNDQFRAYQREYWQKYPQGYPPQPYPPQPYPYPQPQPQPQPQAQPQPQPQPQGPSPGQEGGNCMGGRTCGPGLVCASGLCVKPPERRPAPAQGGDLQ